MAQHFELRSPPHDTVFYITSSLPINAIKLGVSVLAIFTIAFGPFVYMGQMPQLLSRLFPFSRGLCHAYWAPNVWAMYSWTDRVLIYGKQDANNIQSTKADQFIVAPRIGLPVDAAAVNSLTRGLVGDTSFAVLPNVSPRVTFILTLTFQIVGYSITIHKPQS